MPEAPNSSHSSAESVPVAQSGYLPTFRFVPTTDSNVAAFWFATPGIYAEKLAIDGGAKLWGPTSGGVAISLVSDPQWLDATFIEDDSAFVTFEDSQYQVWIKHVQEDGQLGPADAGIDAGPDAADNDGYLPLAQRSGLQTQA